VIAITFALPAESAAFIKALRDKQREPCGEFEIVHGKIDNRTVEIFHTGVGEKSAATGWQRCCKIGGSSC